MKNKIQELANSISNGMFADRATLKEAFKYVEQIAKASGQDAIAVWTAVFVVTNTIAKELNKIRNEEV